MAIERSADCGWGDSLFSTMTLRLGLGMTYPSIASIQLQTRIKNQDSNRLGYIMTLCKVNDPSHSSMTLFRQGGLTTPYAIPGRLLENSLQVTAL